MSREHNRLASDNENTNKQWYGIYTAEEFYSLHLRMCQIDAQLDTILPTELRPIKGYLYTYHTTDLRNSTGASAAVASKVMKKTKKEREDDAACDDGNDGGGEDLHDNQLCHALTFYLNRAFESLGKNLFVDILFNDITADNYFEVYSEFSLSRILAHIDK